MKNSIIESKLFVRRDLDEQDDADVIERFAESQFPHLVSQLLLYDEVRIPTHDFSILPSLIRKMGPELFAQVIERSALSFIRRKGILGYAGAGMGISTFGIAAKPGGQLPVKMRYCFSDISEAVEYYAGSLLSKISKRARNKFVNRVVSATSEPEYSNEDFIEKVEGETFKDIRSATSLKEYFETHYAKEINFIDLKKLEDVKPNEMRMLKASGIVENPVDLIIKTAEINLDLLTSASSDYPAVSVPSDSEDLFRSKLSRSGIHVDRVKDSIKLFALNDIPDIRPAISAGELGFDEVWKLRNSKNAREFREWLAKADPKDADQLVKLYISALKKQPFISSLPARAVRFIITSLVSVLAPAIGVAAGAADSFLVERMLSGYSPRFFIDELSSLTRRSGK
jgi:hypothetical protein